MTRAGRHGLLAGVEEGQATVEVALSIPVLAVFLMLVIQVVLVVRDQVLVTHAAREAAREAAVNLSPEAARRAALAGAPLEPAGLRIEVARSKLGGRVDVRIYYRSPTSVPLVGPLIPDVMLKSKAGMREEV